MSVYTTIPAKKRTRILKMTCIVDFYSPFFISIEIVKMWLPVGIWYRIFASGLLVYLPYTVIFLSRFAAIIYCKIRLLSRITEICVRDRPSRTYGNTWRLSTGRSGRSEWAGKDNSGVLVSFPRSPLSAPYTVWRPKRKHYRNNRRCDRVLRRGYRSVL